MLCAGLNLKTNISAKHYQFCLNAIIICCCIATLGKYGGRTSDFKFWHCCGVRLAIKNKIIFYVCVLYFTGTFPNNCFSAITPFYNTNVSRQILSSHFTRSIWQSILISLPYLITVAAFGHGLHSQRYNSSHN